MVFEAVAYHLLRKERVAVARDFAVARPATLEHQQHRQVVYGNNIKRH